MNSFDGFGDILYLLLLIPLNWGTPKRTLIYCNPKKGNQENPPKGYPKLLGNPHSGSRQPVTTGTAGPRLTSQDLNPAQYQSAEVPKSVARCFPNGPLNILSISVTFSAEKMTVTTRSCFEFLWFLQAGAFCKINKSP